MNGLSISSYKGCVPSGSVVKNLSAMQEMQVRSLGQDDPLEKEMAPHFSTLAWKIPWTEEPGRLQSMESQRVRPNLANSLSLSQSHLARTYSVL